MIWFNMKVAWRNLRKHKLFSLINILGLSVSLTTCLLIGLYVSHELSFDRFHRNHNSIYRLTEQQDQAGSLYNVAVTPGPLASALEHDFPEIVSTVRFGSWSGVFKNNNRAFEEQHVLLTDNTVFKVFDFPLLKGSAANALTSRDQIVITASTAVKYFGNNWESDPGLLDQTIMLDSFPFKLVGVAKDPPKTSSIQFDILLPLQHLFSIDEWANKWNSNNFHTYLQLRTGVNLKSFEKNIRGQLKVYNQSNDLLGLQPIAKQYLQSKFDFQTDWGKRSDIKYVNIFTGVGLLLLVISCINMINLSTARSLKRSLEVGVRKVNGATKRQLIMQFLGEAFLTSFLAGVISLLFIKLSEPGITWLTGQEMHLEITSMSFVSLFAALIFIISLFSGLYPAFIMSSFQPIHVLKGKLRISKRKSFWGALVVFQFGACMALMISAFFMYRQLRYMQAKDLGFDKEQLLNVRLKGNLKGKSNLFRLDLEKERTILGAAPATMSLVNVENTSNFEWEGMSENDKFLITQANVDPNFIPTLDLQLVSGSNFSKQVSNDTANFILNETAAKRMGYFPDKVIGKQITFWGAKGRVIGVVKDFHFKALTTNIEPFIFRYQPEDPYFNLFVKIAPGQTELAIARIKSIYSTYETDSPIDFSFVSDSLNKLYQDEQQTADFILLFTFLTVFVGCLGLFGLSVISAEQRKREIGIRKVLGGSLFSIAKLLSSDFMKLVGLATLIALPVAWYIVTQWLQNYAYRIPVQFGLFLAGGSVVIGIAFFTIMGQSLKAARANPAKNLRTE